MHIGSGPGVSGLSAMHVKPLLPLRKVRILPSAPMATMVACCATLRGAADIALAIIRSSLMGALPSGAFLSAAGCAAGGDFVSAACTLRAKAVAAIVILTNRVKISWLRMVLPLDSMWWLFQLERTLQGSRARHSFPPCSTARTAGVPGALDL